MPNGITKRIVVLKDIKSNIIEEAILILKGDSGVEAGTGEKTHPRSAVKPDNDFIIKEAQMIIENYMRENELKVSAKKDSDSKANPMKSRIVTDIIINSALIASIFLLIFIATRII